MYLEEIEARKEELMEELDNLEGCDNNEVYAERIAEIRRELDRLDDEEPEPQDFEFEVTIVGTVTVSAKTLKEAEAMAYDSCKNHEYIAVQRIDIEEA